MKIDLGCGYSRPNGYVGIDIKKVRGVDIVCDCEENLPFKDDCADEIRSCHFIEHVHSDKVIHLMNEIWRVLKPNAVFVFQIPDAENGQGAFQDPTHRSFWTKNSFKYYAISEYKELYGIKANFKILNLKSVKYEVEYWGENYALSGYLKAIKGPHASTSTIAKGETSLAVRKSQFLSQFKMITCDDVCPSNLKHWKYWMWVKEKYPELRVLCFVIANYQNKENAAESREFKEWFETNKNWIEVGVHGYDHTSPPLGDRSNQEELIIKALEILKPFLPEKFLFRPPGYQRTIHTEKILQKLGFAGIAYQSRIRYFDGEIVEPILNSHLTENRYENPIGKIWNQL